jgi:hypothetical protein
LAALKAKVLHEMRLESIVLSSAVFACIAGYAFSIELDIQNQMFRILLHGIAPDMSRISLRFSRSSPANSLLELRHALH